MVAIKHAFIVSLFAGVALGAPILIKRQGAGVGAGCDSVFSDADTATGEVGKQAGAYLADKLQGSGLRRRQGAGVGQGCDSVFSDADTSTGEVVKQAGAYVADKLVAAEQGGAAKRQLNNIGVGLGDVVKALPGGQSAGEQVISSTGTIDGDGTQGSADLGESIGQAELNGGNALTETLFGTTDGDGSDGSNAGGSGGAPPPPPPAGHKRQLNNIGVGLGDVVEALPGGKSAGEQVISSTGTIDGDGTQGSADLGETIGEAELDLGNAATETAFGTTDNDGTDGDGNGGSNAPPPPPKGH